LYPSVRSGQNQLDKTSFTIYVWHYCRIGLPVFPNRPVWKLGRVFRFNQPLLFVLSTDRNHCGHYPVLGQGLSLGAGSVFIELHMHLSNSSILFFRHSTGGHPSCSKNSCAAIQHLGQQSTSRANRLRAQQGSSGLCSAGRNQCPKLSRLITNNHYSGLPVSGLGSGRPVTAAKPLPV